MGFAPRALVARSAYRLSAPAPPAIVRLRWRAYDSLMWSVRPALGPAWLPLLLVAALGRGSGTIHGPGDGAADGIEP